MNMLAQFAENQKTMSSREIAHLCEKQHSHVLRDIRAYVGAVVQMERGIDVRSMDWDGKEGVQLFGDTPIGGVTYAIEINPQNKQSYPVYHLDKNATLTIVSGYNILLRKRIIDRWAELEQQATKPQITTPHDYLSALKALVVSEEQKQLAIQERDHAIATKAEIGSRREATAMGRLSAKVKEVEKLKTQLDSSTGFATIKKVQALTGGTYDTYELRRYSKTNRLEIQKAEDANYGSVNSYHKDAWLAVYNINLSNLNGAA